MNKERTVYSRLACIVKTYPATIFCRKIIVCLLGTFLLLLSLKTRIIAQNISFSKKTLFGTSLSEPTSLDFGPDGRLYVTQREGDIFVYTVDKTGENYLVLATETINLVKNIPNHNDDGSPSSINKRQVTGILVVGTPTNPIIYASSSDVRIGGGGGSDTFLDTNSGIVARLTWNGSSSGKSRFDQRASPF